jgi:hypothetical protein
MAARTLRLSTERFVLLDDRQAVRLRLGKKVVESKARSAGMQKRRAQIQVVRYCSSSDLPLWNRSLEGYMINIGIKVQSPGPN